MKALFLLGLLAWGSAQAQDPSALFRSSFPRGGRMGALDNQSFCVEDDRGTVYSHRPDASQKIGQISHLVTTVLALDVFRADKTWRTTFTLAGNRLHIAGGRDPWFEEEKILALIEGLRRRGVTSLAEITFDRAFTFGDALAPSHRSLTPDDVQGALSRFFTPSGAFADSRSWTPVVQEFVVSEGLGLPFPSSGIPTASVRLSDSNPLANVRGAQTFTHVSEPLARILKVMNTYQRAKIAQNLWVLAYAQRPPLDTLANYRVPIDNFGLSNGSGLANWDANGVRRDNTASCSALLRVMEALEFLTHERRVDLEDLVATGGDQGSLKSRFLNDRGLKAGVMAQGGSVDDATALAGWVNGNRSYRFILLNQNSSPIRTRGFQEQFLSSWMRSGAGPVQPLDYVREPLAPFTGGFLR